MKKLSQLLEDFASAVAKRLAPPVIEVPILGSAWFETPTRSLTEQKTLAEAFAAVHIDPEARCLRFGADFGKNVVREGNVTAFYTDIDTVHRMQERGLTITPSKKQIRMISERQ
jgi:hypothetical protein